MAHHKSAIKRIKTNEIARGRNRQYRSRMRTMVKKVVNAGERETAEPLLKETLSLLDKLVNRMQDQITDVKDDKDGRDDLLS